MRSPRRPGRGCNAPLPMRRQSGRSRIHAVHSLGQDWPAGPRRICLPGGAVGSPFGRGAMGCRRVVPQGSGLHAGHRPPLELVNSTPLPPSRMPPHAAGGRRTRLRVQGPPSRCNFVTAAIERAFVTPGLRSGLGGRESPESGPPTAAGRRHLADAKRFRARLRAAFRDRDPPAALRDAPAPGGRADWHDPRARPVVNLGTTQA